MYLGEMFKHELREICKFCCPCTGSNYVSIFVPSIKASRHILMGKWSKSDENQINFIDTKGKQAKPESDSSSLTAGQSGLDAQAEVDLLNYSDLFIQSEIKKGMFSGGSTRHQ